MADSYTVEEVAAVFPDYRINGSEMPIRDCPECGDSKYRFWINPVKGVGYCYKCAYAPVLSTLLGAATLSSIGRVPAVEAPGLAPLPPMSPVEGLSLSSPGWEFIQRRRLDVEALIANKAGYCPEGRFRNRLIFPFYGKYSGDYRGFQGRWVFDLLPNGTPKWITGLGTKKSRFLWNFDRVISQQKWCVLVEGVFDALRIPNWGVAMLGKTVSAQQREMLEYFDYIFIMLDADATEDAKNLSQTVVRNAVFRAQVVELEEGDPDSNDPEDIAALLRAAALPGFYSCQGSEVLAG